MSGWKRSVSTCEDLAYFVFLTREETVDDIAKRIPVSFDVSSILKSLTEQFSAPSISQYIPSINKGERHTDMYTDRYQGI